jgi:hypothetical protein
MLQTTVAITLSALVTGCGGSMAPDRIPQATPGQLEAAGLGKLRLAPDDRRVDLDVPTFSHPTEITNPLFPISDLTSAVLSGHVEGKPFHTETTLLPRTRIIEWPAGHRVETLVSQYVAYLDGRIEEVALDHYAQADDGAVWYFGEDVFDYEDGVIVSREGTWLAGPDTPPAMIMPAHPEVGDVYRSENFPGLVFEEVTVTRTGVTVRGPHGPVEEALVGEELHSEGSREDKTFAPGYGEFFTGGDGDVEAMALAVPADALEGTVPASLETLSTASSDAFDLARSGSWERAPTTLTRLKAAWADLRKESLPPRIALELNRALENLSASVGSRDRNRAAAAAIDVEQSALDLELRYRPPVEIDRARFGLWAEQVLVDAAARDTGGVRGDVSVLEWIRDRVVSSLGEVDRTRLDTELTELRADATDENFRGATAVANRLQRVVSDSRHG